MARLEQKSNLDTLKTGANLLGYGAEQAGTAWHYRGGVYSDQNALTDELLFDLGSRLRSL